MKRLISIFLLPLLFCSTTYGQHKSEAESASILKMKFIPSYISLKAAYELKSPVIKIMENGIVYLNQWGVTYKGKLSKRELNELVSSLSRLGLFDLTMDTLRAAAMDDVLYADGSKTKLFYRLNDKSDSLTFGSPDFVPDSLIWKLPSDYNEIPWYNKLEERVARIQTYINNFRPSNFKPFNGPKAAVFLDCDQTQFGCTGSFVSTSADSFYVESISKPKEYQPWPVDNLEPKISIGQSLDKAREVKIITPETLKEIETKGVKSGDVYSHNGKTFAVYFRPLFCNYN